VDTPILRLSKAALANVASKDTTRDNLRVMHLENGGAVSTDGHRLIKMPFEGSHLLTNGESFDIPIDAIEAARKALKKSDAMEIDLDATRANGSVSISAGPVSLKPAKPETEFPKWQQVIPSDRAPFRVGVNPAYLAELSEILGNWSREHTKGSACSIALEFQEKDGGIDEFAPIRIVARRIGLTGQDEEALAVLMPNKVHPR